MKNKILMLKTSIELRIVELKKIAEEEKKELNNLETTVHDMRYTSCLARISELQDILLILVDGE